jgi:glycosyltransferase involved in cell wall biosynthesis
VSIVVDIPGRESVRLAEAPVKPLKILHLTTTDPAGSAFNMIRAVNTHTPHRARLFTSARIQQYQFPSDISDIFDTGDELEALLEEADVFHFHKVREEDMQIEFALENLGITRHFNVADYMEMNGKRKKVVYHIHGHPSERNFPEERAAEYAKKNAVVLASTPDLEEMYRKFYPNVHYFPNCVPINDVLYLPRASDKLVPWGKLPDGSSYMTHLLVQSPTNTILKNVDMIKDVIERVGAELPVRYVQIWNATQEQALRHKRNGHIIFDHIEGYYGLSSLEGLSMGKPVIAGLSPYTINAICEFFKIEEGLVPWMIARNAEEVEQQIRSLVTDPAWRSYNGARGRQFMEEVWSDAAIARRLAVLYESL